MRTLPAAALAASLLTLAACGSGSSDGSRDFVRVVGSSTVYPFAAAVAESVAKTAGLKTPVTESTGTGAGIKLFCAGEGVSHPDVANASRRMKKSEFESCQAAGVKNILEIQVGLDGLAFAEGKNGPSIPLTTADVYKALAANPFGKPNTAKTWKDVNPSLPAIPINVFGPPTTSGTRDSLHELVLIPGCESDPAMKALKDSDKDKHKDVCTTIRSDGAYVEQGENDNLIVQKVSQNPNAIGVFGFSFLDANRDTLKGLTLNGVEAKYDTVADYSYPGARPMYIYVKATHLDAIKGLKEYLAEWEKSWGKDGPLQKKGMLIAPEDVRKASAEVIATRKLMDGADLK